MTGEARIFSFSNTKDPRLWDALKASCMIPSTFHPIEILSSRQVPIYSEGVLIDGEYYCDGGIAAPVPPTPDSYERVEVMPFDSSSECPCRIAPGPATFPSVTLRGGTRVSASWKNLKALRVAMGGASSADLQEWYERGQEDADHFMGRCEGR